MKHSLRALFLTFSLAVITHVAAAEKYTIDPVHSTAGFKVKHLFSYVTGRFTDISGTIDLDTAKPENSAVDVKIATKSVNTTNDKRDTHLRSPDFFDVEKFPEMTFKSKKVTRTGENTADVTGDFTLHGVTKELTLNVKFLGKGPGMMGVMITGWEATTMIKRSDYGLVWNKLVEGVSAVGDEVQIDLQVEAPLAK